MSQTLPKRTADESVLQELVHQLTIDYLEHFHTNKRPENVYRRIVDEIENTLFSTTMKYTFGNQSKAAEYLGINRATLRTKLKRHDLM